MTDRELSVKRYKRWEGCVGSVCTCGELFFLQHARGNGGALGYKHAITHAHPGQVIRKSASRARAHVEQQLFNSTDENPRLTLGTAFAAVGKGDNSERMSNPTHSHTQRLNGYGHVI